MIKNLPQAFRSNGASVDENGELLVSRGKFQIRVTHIKEKREYKMMLIDLNGKSIMEEKMNLGLKTNVNSFTFPSQQAKAVYFVQIADIFNRTIYLQQLIVE